MANPHLLESSGNFFKLLVCSGAVDNTHSSYFKVSLNSLVQVYSNSIVGSNEFTVLDWDKDCW